MAEVTDDRDLMTDEEEEERRRRLEALAAPTRLAPVGAPSVPAARTVAAEAPAVERLQPVGVDALSPTSSLGETPRLQPLSYAERSRLSPVSPGAPAGSAASYQSKIDKIEDERAHPWGSPENHPGFGGRLAHVLAKAGNIAGDIVAPVTMTNIPGTELHRNAEERGLAEERDKQQRLETERRGVEERPEIAEATGELKGRLERQREESAERIAQGKTGSAEKIAGGKEASAEKIAEGRETSAEKIAEGRTKSAAAIAKERAASAERIAVGHNLAITEAARIRAAAANDPDKLTNTMKTMKQQAQSTLPGIDRALDETEKVAGLLGPGEGRWNEFWQGKVGVSDPKFAHYKDEIALVSSAVTLAHARGRMSNELFEHFQKMFDVGKQAPENMIQALNVAKEWLTEYAHMGETPAASGETPQRPKGVPNEAVWNKDARQWQLPKKP
jgi:hypothetical protein